MLVLIRKDEDPGNYRPVTLTLTPEKIFGAGHQEMYKHLGEIKVIRKSQHAFTKN